MARNDVWLFDGRLDLPLSYVRQHEAYIIPTSQDQPTTANAYNPASPAQYAPEFDLPNQYPTPLNPSVAVGQDPIAAELRATYGTPEIYGMHWILDVDNWYGYGRRGDGTSRPSYINTFQRGPQESVWETVTHPSWENFRWGGGATRGFLPLFILDATYTPQWRYTNAPDADARLVQAMYWAKQFADAQGGNTVVDGLVGEGGEDGGLSSLRHVRQIFQDDGLRKPFVPARDGVRLSPLSIVLVLLLGRSGRHIAELGVSHRLQLQSLRLSKSSRRLCPVNNASAQTALA